MSPDDALPIRRVNYDASGRRVNALALQEALEQHNDE